MQITQQNRNLVLIAVYAPLAISLTLAASYLAPLWEEAEKQHKEVDSKEIEYRAVQDRMMQKNRLIGARNTLEQDIIHLRSAVPSTADLDVLILDLQKMARMANVEILSIEANNNNNHNGEKDRDPYSADQELEAMFANISGINRDKDKTLLKPKDTVTSSTTALSKDQAPPLGIKQIQRRLYVSGQYATRSAYCPEDCTYQDSTQIWLHFYVHSKNTSEYSPSKTCLSVRIKCRPSLLAASPVIS